jgi:hypothetical protein
MLTSIECGTNCYLLQVMHAICAYTVVLSQASLQTSEQAPARIWLQKALLKYSQPEKAQDSQPQSSSSAKQRGGSNSGSSSSSDSSSVAVSKFKHGKRGNDLLAALLENGLMIATSFKM